MAYCSYLAQSQFLYCIITASSTALTRCYSLCDSAAGSSAPCRVITKPNNCCALLDIQGGTQLRNK